MNNDYSPDLGICHILNASRKEKETRARELVDFYNRLVGKLKEFKGLDDPQKANPISLSN
jgi:hypothetical protein